MCAISQKKRLMRHMKKIQEFSSREYFKDKDYNAVPAVLCKNHGPFTWGKDAHEAVHNAVVLEEVAKMASRCEMINPDVKPAPQELLRISAITENMVQTHITDKK